MSRAAGQITHVTGAAEAHDDGAFDARHRMLA
jgi:hypothetical protein